MLATRPDRIWVVEFLYKGYFLKILQRFQLRGVEKIRLVGQGKNEIVSVEEAFREAEAKDLDLVCVSDKADPMVVRIEDFKKIEYEKKKAKKSQKAASRTGGMKEMQFKLHIAEHDLNVKLDKVRSFLERGDKVKAVVRLRGREKAHPELARDLIKNIVERLEAQIAQPGGPPHIAIIESTAPKKAP